VNIPTQVLGAIQYSLFPAISNAHGGGNANVLARTYLSAAQAVLLIGAPVMAGLALTADQIVAVLLGDSWATVGSLIRLLTPFGFLQAVSIVNTSLLLGIGQSGLEFRMASLRAACVAAGIATGLRWGAEGVAACVSAGYALATFFYIRVALRAAGISVQSLLREASAPAAACIALVLGVTVLRALVLDRMMPVTSLCLTIAAGIAIYLSVIAFSFRSSLDVLLSQIKSPKAKQLA
jgi:PST family polysaccharide transporter